MQSTAASRSKRFDGEDFSLFHLRLIGVLDERDRLSTMDTVVIDVVCRNVTDWLHLVRLPADFNFVAFHSLLDRGAYITNANVDSRSLQNR